MAAFTEETHLYEILIRVSNTGVWAAQYQNLTVVKKDGEVISAATSDVAPLTPDDTASFEVVSQLIGEASARNMTILKQLLETETAQIELIAELNGKVVEQAVAIEELKGQLEKLKSGSTSAPKLGELA